MNERTAKFEQVLDDNRTVYFLAIERHLFRTHYFCCSFLKTKQNTKNERSRTKVRLANFIAECLQNLFFKMCRCLDHSILV